MKRRFSSRKLNPVRNTVRVSPSNSASKTTRQDDGLLLQMRHQLKPLNHPGSPQQAQRVLVVNLIVAGMLPQFSDL